MGTRLLMCRRRKYRHRGQAVNKICVCEIWGVSGLDSALVLVKQIGVSMRGIGALGILIIDDQEIFFVGSFKQAQVWIVRRFIPAIQLRLVPELAGRASTGEG